MLKNLNILLRRRKLRNYATVEIAKKISECTQVGPESVSEEKRKPPIITCKRSQFNLYTPESSDKKFGTLPLASKGWLHHKSKNDHFTIKAIISEQEIRATKESIEDFIRRTEINLRTELIRNLMDQWRIDKFTSIQIQSIPSVFKSNHTLIAAETGCGKTLAYLLPIVQKILEFKDTESALKDGRQMNTPYALIISPSRELATQIGQVAEQLSNGTPIKVKTILGGNTKQLMMNPVFEEVDILSASIGALSKLVTTGIVRVDQVRFVVLDEADTLLDDSFAEKLGAFLKRFPFHKNHTQDEHTVGTQMILASATMPTSIEDLLAKVIDTSTIHEIISPSLHRVMSHVEQKFLRMSKASRPETLYKIVNAEVSKRRPVIIFSNKSVASDYVSMHLNKCGINCLNLNGDMLMKIRIGRFQAFQNGECDVLSTTDVGSRGLDTIRARHVINFDFPLYVSDYIHRCGRIGRVGQYGKCFVTNFISSGREIDIVQRIEHAARTGGLLPDVNANIKNLIHRRILKDMEKSGLPLPEDEPI